MLPSTLETWADLAVIIQTVAFIVSVYFVWVQIREGNRLRRVANNRSSFQLSSPYLIRLFQDEKLSALYLNGAKNFETLDELEQFRYIQMMGWWLTLHDDVYYQHQNGLFDDNTYQGWDVELGEFVKFQRVDLYWDQLKRFYRPDFQALIDQKLQASRGAKS